MDLSFNQFFPNEDQTLFKEFIQQRAKKHSFRMSYKRRPGQDIQFQQTNNLAIGKPKEPFSINKGLAEFWTKSPVKDSPFDEYPLIAAIESWAIQFVDPKKSLEAHFRIGELIIDENMLEVVALSDGFRNGPDLLAYFWRVAIERKVKHLEGQLVHWNTHTVYDEKRALTYKPLSKSNQL